MTVEKTRQVEVTVFGHRFLESCTPRGWGPARSSAETARIAEFYLQLRYGSDVRLEYVDLADPEGQARFPELVSMVESRGLSYPLVAIEGQVTLAGSADFYHILPLVEQVLEAEA